MAVAVLSPGFQEEFSHIRTPETENGQRSAGSWGTPSPDYRGDPRESDSDSSQQEEEDKMEVRRYLCCLEVDLGSASCHPRADGRLQLPACRGYSWRPQGWFSYIGIQWNVLLEGCDLS